MRYEHASEIEGADGGHAEAHADCSSEAGLENEGAVADLLGVCLWSEFLFPRCCTEVGWVGDGLAICELRWVLEDDFPNHTAGDELLDEELIGQEALKWSKTRSVLDHVADRHDHVVLTLGASSAT